MVAGSSANVSIGNQNGPNANATVTAAGCGLTEGSIDINVDGGVEPYLFSLNGGDTQNESNFSGLTSGDYQVEIIDQGGCQTSVTVSLGNGTSYKDEIIPIIELRCAIADCHDGSDTALPDWTQYVNVEAQSENIKRRTSNRTMPPPGSQALTTSEIQAIACWVDDGALNN